MLPLLLVASATAIISVTYNQAMGMMYMAGFFTGGRYCGLGKLRY